MILKRITRLFNMIIHRDYRSSSDSIVKIFNDKIEFYNPGRLPDTISVEDLLSNNYKSTPRNKKIAEFFKDLGLIEKYGSGIGRIIDYFKNDGLPAPEFKNISDGFQVTVFAVIAEKSSEKSSEILQLIKNNSQITIEELSILLNKSTRAIEKHIANLRNKGLLERIDGRKQGHWKVINNI